MLQNKERIQFNREGNLFIFNKKINNKLCY